MEYAASIEPDCINMAPGGGDTHTTAAMTGGVAVIALVVCWVCFVFAAFLLTPAGFSFLQALSLNASATSALWIIVAINCSAVAYIIYFVYTLRDRDRIWLVSIFFAWSIILGSGGSIALGLQIEISIGDFGRIVFGSDSLTKLGSLALGIYLLNYSTKKYKTDPSRANLVK